jgi:hypothetical protein
LTWLGKKGKRVVMKTTSIFLMGGFLILGSAVAACSSDSDSNTSTTTTSTTTGAGGGTTGAGGGTTGAGGDTSTTGTGGTGGGATALSCDTYCATIAANCTDANLQYADPAFCATSCAGYPVGAATDTSGDTLGCRTYHAAAAATDPATHCPHAGPGGGDGICGTSCEAFCDIVVHSCTGANQVYTDKAACMTACGNFDATTPYTPGATGNNLACRLYHATAASADPDTHCPHTAENSPVCTD